MMLEVRIVCPDHIKEIILAELSALPFEGFWDHADVIFAYTSPANFSREALSGVLRKYGVENNFSLLEVPPTNWNETWESNFHPFELDRAVRIRATFHDSDPGFPVELIINPQMSFGTGHHETTELMIRMMLDTDFHSKSVLDMGSGTGVLAILAEKLGASRIIAFDNDEWACNNIKENLELNHSKHIEADFGDLETLRNLRDTSFDIVLSNITKNINLSLLPELARLVSKGGMMILSGFLDFDLKEVQDAASQNGLCFDTHLEKNGWQVARFNK